MKVFISWRGSDRDLKNKLVSTLREGLDEGDEVWESDEHCLSDFSKECIEQIRQSQVVVVIVSDKTFEESFVETEVVEAHLMEIKGALNIVVYRVTDTEYPPKFAANLNHVSDVNHLARMSGRSGEQDLLKKVRYLLALRRAGTPEKPVDVFEPEIEGTAISTPGFFVPESRNTSFDELERAFEYSNAVFVSELDGYGKRSAIRKYVEVNADKYDKTIIIPFFKGSIRQFFLSGLVITNINEKAFEGMDDEHIILKKASLLEKLSARTLIVVPGVVSDSTDNEFIADLLAKIGCRIIFIMQSNAGNTLSIPKVNIGRMENKYLYDLFFHYYDMASEEEKTDLYGSLDEFFDSVDGHTKSIELAASAISDEYDVYPEDVPEILQKITVREADGLAGRIFGLISNLFDITDFSENEKLILVVASLVANIPIDQREFVNLLKCCGCNTDGMKKLAERGWIDVDRVNRTVSVDGFLSAACIGKIKITPKIINTCIGILSEQAMDEHLEIKLNKASATLMRISRVLTTAKGFENCNKLITWYDEFLLKGNVSANNSEVREAMSYATSEVEESNLKNETKEKLDWIVQITGKELGLLASAHELSVRTGTDKYDDAMAKVIQQNFSEIVDVITEFSSQLERMAPKMASFMMKVVRYVQESRNMTAMVKNYISLVDSFLEVDREKLTDEISPAFYEAISIWISGMGYQLSTLVHTSPYIHVRICEAKIKLESEIGIFTDGRELIFQLNYLSSLMKIENSPDVLRDVFLEICEYHKNSKNEYENVILTMFSVIDEYISKNCELKSVDYAVEAYDFLEKIPSKENAVVLKMAENMQKITDAYIVMGETDNALEFIESKKLDKKVKDFENSDDENFVEAVSIWSEILSVVKILTSGGDYRETGFGDATDEYMNYYQAYGDTRTDRRALSLYREIADRIAEFDLSGESREELLARIDRLKTSALRAVRWQSIAPEVFAIVSEAGYRMLGYRHHYVQYLGALAMADGKIAQLQNGEGKTYTIVLTAILKAVYGKQVHIADSSEYLSERNYVWMRSIYEYLGFTVGCNCSGDTRRMYCGDRLRALSGCEIIYAYFYKHATDFINFEILANKLPIRFDAVIVDEADVTMIEKGSGEIWIAGNEVVRDNTSLAETVFRLVCSLDKNDRDLFEYKNNRVNINMPLYQMVETELGKPFSVMTSEEVSNLESFLTTAIDVIFFQKNEKDYFIRKTGAYYENKVSGELEACSALVSWLIGKKEGKPELCNNGLKQKNIVNIGSHREFIEKFSFVCGTTATAVSLRKEFQNFYGCEVVDVPPNIPVVRVDYKPATFILAKNKYREIAELVKEKNSKGQPVLLISESIEESKIIYEVIRRENVEAKLLNAQNSDKEADLLSEAGLLGAVTVTTAMANRGVDICLGGNPLNLAKKHLLSAGCDPELLSRAIYGMESDDSDIQLIRKRFQDLVLLYRASTEPDKKTIEELGGLCVIATSCFEDLRTEQQARGRCGRQGSPGESYVFFSYDDEQLNRFIGERMNFIRKIVNDNPECDGMNSALLDKAILRSRLMIQKARYSQLERMPTVLYYGEAKELILSPLKSFSRQGSATEFMLSYFDDTAERLREIEQSKNRFIIEKNAMTVLYEMFSDEIKDVPKRKLPQILKDKFFERICQQFNSRMECIDELALRVLTRTLNDSWADYIKCMASEMSEAGKNISLYAKYKEHITEFSRHQSKRLYSKALSETCLRMLRCRVKSE